MTPTEFDFKVKMPGDARLVGAIRQLTAHAAGYAQLTPAAGEQLATQVERATEACITASNPSPSLMEYRFTADAASLTVVFTCDAALGTPRPAATGDGITVEWGTEGTRHVCRIRQVLTGA